MRVLVKMSRALVRATFEQIRPGRSIPIDGTKSPHRGYISDTGKGVKNARPIGVTPIAKKEVSMAYAELLSELCKSPMCCFYRNVL